MGQLPKAKKKVFSAQGAKNLLQWCKWSCTGAKQGLDSTKDSCETFPPSIQSTFCFAPSPNHSWEFPHLRILSQVLWFATLPLLAFVERGFVKRGVIR